MEQEKLIKEMQTFNQQLTSLHKLLINDDGTPKFATKEDVAPVLDFYKNLLLAAKITTTSGRWFYRILLVAAAVTIAWGVVFGGFKTLVGGIVAWAATR